MNTIHSAASNTSMASCHKTNNHIEMRFELTYEEGFEHFVCVVVISDKEVIDQPNKENKVST
jgi:hypothetical protein